MSALHVVFPTAGDVVAAVVIVGFWLTLAYFALRDDGRDDAE